MSDAETSAVAEVVSIAWNREVARCIPCFWRGPERRSRQLAIVDALAHDEAHHDGEVSDAD